MALKLDRPNLAITFALPVASALAFYFGTGLHPIWWLAWLAPLPVLWLATRLPLWQAFAGSLLASFAGWLNLWNYLRSVLGVPSLAILVSLFLPAIIFALGVLLFRWFVRRGAPLQAALAFPAFWVCSEFLNAATSVHSTAGNLAYSQMNFLPILQIASVTGIWGISFFVLLLSATIAAIPCTPGYTREKKLLITTAALLLGGTLALGTWRLHTAKPSSVATVALIASDLPQNELPSKQEDALRLFRDYAAQVDALSGQHVQAIVIPEKIAVALPAYISEVDSLFSGAAARTGAVVIVGMVRRDSNGLWNEARIYTPDGAPPLTYEKHHMLPPFESKFIIGTKREVFTEPSGLWGVAICKDMDFPRLSREYGLAGAGLLLVPAWDFDADGWLHGRMSFLRAVEDGFSIARAPRHGILTVTDDRGRVLAERNTKAQPFTVLVAQVPVRHDATLYLSWGNWFPWCCVLTLLVSVVTVVKSRY
ncbi:MAG: nitrilase-related carbon-nitrogen hydrolase [Candidatus Acidiferrum sp.]